MNSLFLQLPAIAIALVGGELPATEFPGEDYRWNPFTPVQRPPVPSAGNPDWVGNPIDSFIAAGHRSRGLRPRPEAPREVLLRRVYLDLIGLPPFPSETNSHLPETPHSKKAPNSAIYRPIALDSLHDTLCFRTPNEIPKAQIVIAGSRSMEKVNK